MAPEHAEGVSLRGAERVGGTGVGLRKIETWAEQFAQAPYDAAEHLLDVVVRRSGQREEARTLHVADEHAVRNHAMKVHVEVGTSSALQIRGRKI